MERLHPSVSWPVLSAPLWHIRGYLLDAQLERPSEESWRRRTGPQRLKGKVMFAFKSRKEAGDPQALPAPAYPYLHRRDVKGLRDVAHRFLVWLCVELGLKLC